MPGALVEHSCGTLSQNSLAGHSCGALRALQISWQLSRAFAIQRFGFPDLMGREDFKKSTLLDESKPPKAPALWVGLSSATAE